MVRANKKKDNLKSKILQVESDDERDARLDAVLSHACGNLNENLQDLESDHIIDLSPVRREKKSSTAKILKMAEFPKNQKPLLKLLPNERGFLE